LLFKFIHFLMIADRRNSGAEMPALNAGRFAGSGVGQ
jgi:hypothetical protein